MNKITNLLGKGLGFAGTAFTAVGGFLRKFATLLARLYPWVNAWFVWTLVLKSCTNNLVYRTFIGTIFNDPKVVTDPANTITFFIMALIALSSLVPKMDEFRLIIQMVVVAICGLLNALLGQPMWWCVGMIAFSVYLEGIMTDKYAKRAPSKKDRYVVKDGQDNPIISVEKGKV
jgi:hypothetical protein